MSGVVDLESSRGLEVHSASARSVFRKKRLLGETDGTMTARSMERRRRSVERTTLVQFERGLGVDV